jgi:hypothetical protein
MEGSIKMNKNDEKIIALKEQISKKKNQLDKAKKFIPITNCSIEIDGVRYNIQVLTKEQLIMLLVKLNSYSLSAGDLGLLNSFTISGYLVNDWITDIKSKLDVVNYKEEELKLKDLENKLDKLLSDEKKTELELNEIEDYLK